MCYSYYVDFPFELYFVTTPLYVISVSLFLQPLLVRADADVIPTFWAHNGIKAANARNFIIFAKSFREGSFDFALLKFPTPIHSPYLLSQLLHIFSPIQLSTGPTAGRLLIKCLAPSSEST
mmetsp:Transcript_32205/g.54958  ORF Transcript_32205/g.54958 Transcript_32205/m.54958 type:complete len:121 (-) Transcript_32205:235-597(-)